MSTRTAKQAKTKAKKKTDNHAASLERARQEQFCQNIVKGMRTSDAYRAAGYTAKNDATAAACASRLLKKANVSARLLDLKAKAAEKATLTGQWVIERLMRNADIAMGDVTVRKKIKPKDSDTTVEIDVTERDAAAANRALELLGKTAGVRLFVEQIERGGPGDFERMSLEDLQAFIQAEQEAIGLFEAEAGSDSIN